MYKMDEPVKEEKYDSIEGDFNVRIGCKGKEMRIRINRYRRIKW